MIRLKPLLFAVFSLGVMALGVAGGHLLHPGAARAQHAPLVCTDIPCINSGRIEAGTSGLTLGSDVDPMSDSSAAVIRNTRALQDGDRMLTMVSGSKECFIASHTGLIGHQVGATIIAASAIAAEHPIVHIAGSTPIRTIYPPAILGTTPSRLGGAIFVIADTPISWTTGGNIARAGSAAPKQLVTFVHDSGTGIWYPPQ